MAWNLEDDRVTAWPSFRSAHPPVREQRAQEKEPLPRKEAALGSRFELSTTAGLTPFWVLIDAVLPAKEDEGHSAAGTDVIGVVDIKSIERFFDANLCF